MQWFTIYWDNGSITHISGESIEDALTKTGYSDELINTIYLYEYGITDSHFYNKENKEWEKREEEKFIVEKFNKFTIKKILEIFDKSHNITVEFENKDILIFEQNYGNFFINKKSVYVQYISIAYGEYKKGSYFIDEIEVDEYWHYFMMANRQYFKPDNLKEAINVFMKRVNQNPYLVYKDDNIKTIDEIFESQEIKYEE